MKSLSPSIRTTALLLAFAMPLTLDAETSASSAGGINLSTSGCGIDLDAPKHVCRNVDDDQPGPHEKHELWDIDHAPSEGENDLRMLTITGVAGLNGGNMTLEVPDEAELGLIRFWKDPGKEEPAYQFSWEVDPFSFRQEEIWVEGYDVGKVRFKAKMTCYPSEVKTTTATTKVYEIDLDIDSLNDNADPYSADGYTDDEDRIEASEKELDGVKKPGKIIISVPNEDHDADATPDFADLEIAGKKFVPVRVTLKTPFKTDKTKVSFEFEESKFKPNPQTGPPAPLAKGGMRLWKKDAPSRAAADSIESKDASDKLIEHSWEDIIKNAAVVSQDKREVILYVEYVEKEIPEAAGRKSIAVTAKEVEGEEGEESAGQCEDQITVTLLPVEIEVKRGGIGNNSDRVPTPPTWRSQSGMVRDVVSVWDSHTSSTQVADLKGDWMQVRVTLGGQTAANLPANFVAWTIDGHPAPPPNTLETPRLSWPGNFGAKTIIATVGSKEFKVHVDIPNVGSIGHVGWATTVIALRGDITGLIAITLARGYGTDETTWSGGYAGTPAEQNALRHSSWIAHCASQSLIGPSLASSLGYAHENDNFSSGNNWAYESTMDIHNNLEGVASNHSTLLGNPDTAAIRADVIAKLTAGTLWIWDGPGAEHTGFKATLKSNNTSIFP